MYILVAWDEMMRGHLTSTLHYVMDITVSIESVGILHPYDLFCEATNTLVEKCRLIRQELGSLR